MRFLWMVTGMVLLVVLDVGHDTNLWWAEWGSSVLLGGFALWAIGRDGDDRRRRQQ